MLPRVGSLRNENSFDRWMKTQGYIGHLSRVIQCKPTISVNNLTHRQYPISRKKGRRPVNNYSQIKLENRCLLRKLTDIITKSTEAYGIGRRRPHSLNGTQRKKELIRITKENRALLTRIREKESCYPLRKIKSMQRKKLRSSTPRVFMYLNKTIVHTSGRKSNKKKERVWCFVLK
eukprot:TRINITY_DN33_c0_g1_i1.p1 TRINITY_DN33_c0_g1~~TRINITY_DN33_c0_g1_i1.p1  ORF type:complete len:184 (-),score=14.17 TRINITY_DN33_c0_g1_i1:139-666(-)